jgi:hypothetical protein
VEEEAEMTEDEEYASDLATGRRCELRLSNDCLMALQYFPEFDNVTFSFYSKNLPGFIIGLPTQDWPLVQKFVADFNWRGKRQ